MSNKIKQIIKNWKVCKENKYDRRPNQTAFSKNTIPTYPGEIIHVDIQITNGKTVLTALDKSTKFAITKILNSRSIEDVRRRQREVIFYFGVPKHIDLDNELTS